MIYNKRANKKFQSKCRGGGGTAKDLCFDSSGQLHFLSNFITYSSSVLVLPIISLYVSLIFCINASLSGLKTKFRYANHPV